MATKTTMRALTIATYGLPSTYGIATLPVPKISSPDDILIEVHAASINPVDVKRANGIMKLMTEEKFPLQIGYDVSGRVVQVGDAVTRFKPGDSVYSNVPQHHIGTVADFALSNESCTALKPASLSYTEAASIPLAALTALQSVEAAARELPGGLEGKTVLIPGGLSGTGSFAIQFVKNVFGAAKVITSLSTGKIAKAKELLGADTFQAIDYTKQDVAKEVGTGAVDFVFDTMGTGLGLVKSVKRNGVIVSISGLPPGGLLRKNLPASPHWLTFILDVAFWVRKQWVGWHGVKYEYLFTNPNGADLDRITEWVDAGKVKPIVGRTAKLDDIEAIRSACQAIYNAKGGVGKFVVEVQ